MVFCERHGINLDDRRRAARAILRSLIDDAHSHARDQPA
jgi:hypothetical protein